MILEVRKRHGKESARYYALHVHIPTKISLRIGGMLPSKLGIIYACHTLLTSTDLRRSWLFALFQGGDANFRMICKKVSSEGADPTLSPGLSYFVEITKYYEHLAQYGDQKDIVCISYAPPILNLTAIIALYMCQTPCC